MVSHLDPGTRHYPDRDAKERLNNSSSMPEFAGRSESAALASTAIACARGRQPAGNVAVAVVILPAIVLNRRRMDDRGMTVQDSVAVQALAARLSPGFTLGVASAAFQIEGSLAAGGRGPSGWDAFAEKPGSILHGHSPAVACDHYNRAAEDVELMRELGIDSYRFSISWPRIQPEGTGRVQRARAWTSTTG